MGRDVAPALTELSAIVTPWPNLPESVRAGIVAMVQAVAREIPF